MDEDQSRQVGGFGALDVDGVHAVAADVGQLANIGIGLLELAGLIGGVADCCG